MVIGETSIFYILKCHPCNQKQDPTSSYHELNSLLMLLNIGIIYVLVNFLSTFACY